MFVLENLRKEVKEISLKLVAMYEKICAIFDMLQKLEGEIPIPGKLDSSNSFVEDNIENIIRDHFITKESKLSCVRLYALLYGCSVREAKGMVCDILGVDRYQDIQSQLKLKFRR